jgi:hypothetical protein
MPRFVLYDRIFRPTEIVRIVEPVSGTPRIRVVCGPRLGWSRRQAVQVQGSNHVRFEGFPAQLRLTTDLPISYLSGKPFALTERQHLVLTWGAAVEEPLQALCSRFLDGTLRYWRRWIKECSVPPLFQREVIRSALALKLHCFEDTGAIVAAMTTSIPEAPGSGRTWDYRYCWLRDAYYALSAFRLLGCFEEREQFIRYLINVASSSPDLDLAPLYRVDAETDLEERVLAHWPGFGGDGPVRVGNAAATQRQHDVFGEMALALVPVFLDDRFSAERSPATLALLQRLAHKAIAVAGTPDAGIWEIRASPRTQTFSSVMCWAEWTAWPRWRRDAAPIRPAPCARRPTGSAPTSWSAPGARSAGAWRPGMAGRNLTPPCCRRPACGCCSPKTRAWRRRWRPCRRTSRTATG